MTKHVTCDYKCRFNARKFDLYLCVKLCLFECKN